jgi:hypothetical protein
MYHETSVRAQGSLGDRSIRPSPVETSCSLEDWEGLYGGIELFVRTADDMTAPETCVDSIARHVAGLR